VKSEWFDNRVRLNFTGFWSTYKDLQTDVFAAGATGATSVTVNAGEAEISGIEAELLAVPIDGLTINGNVGWISPKYNEYNLVNNNGTPGNPADDFTQNFADDAKFGYKPEVTATAGVEYATPPMGSLGWVFTPRIDLRYTASRVWSPLDDEAPFPVATAFRDALEDDGYLLLDVRMTVSEIALNDRAKVKMSVYGKNITDESYLLSGIDFGGLDFAGGIFGEPATWGLDFTIDY
jgi:iron complex outermembrane receptor protein